MLPLKSFVFNNVTAVTAILTKINDRFYRTLQTRRPGLLPPQENSFQNNGNGVTYFITQLISDLWDVTPDVTP
jgi:hypothetical protein